MKKPTPIQEGREQTGVQSLIVDGCKVTLRFAEQSAPGAVDGIRNLLLTAIKVENKQSDFLQK